VKCERSIAEGTLLINWHESTEKRSVSLLKRDESKELTASILERFPAKIKKKKKVPSNE
jgi:hypothetical protein